MVAAADWSEAMVWKGEDVWMEVVRDRLWGLNREACEVADTPPALSSETDRAVGVVVLERRSDLDSRRLTADMMFSWAFKTCSGVN